jgi:hypothetical protein
VGSGRKVKKRAANLTKLPMPRVEAIRTVLGRYQEPDFNKARMVCGGVREGGPGRRNDPIGTIVGGIRSTTRRQPFEQKNAALLRRARARPYRRAGAGCSGWKTFLQDSTP